MTEDESLQPESDSPARVSVSVSFEGLDATQFEEFCFDLLVASGYSNVDWRKGTAKRSSPSDRGRDLVGTIEQEDADGHHHGEAWFVDCKHYKRGVPPEELQGLMTWAEAERPAVALVIASGFLSNPAKDWLAQYERNRHPPFRIRYWERPQLERLVTAHPDLIYKHDLEVEGFRSVAEILEAESERYDRLWYGRKPKDGYAGQDVPADILETMRREMKRIEEKYGYDAVQPGGDFEWGVLSGELSALRWVLGEEWGMLDT